MKLLYCPTCGNKLSLKEIGDEGMIPYCQKCLKPWFDITYPTVIVLVVNENKEVLLLKQNEVTKDFYVLVAGYHQPGETLESTAIREVLEETGQVVNKFVYQKSFYYEKKDNIISGFIAYVKKQPFNQSLEVDELKWATIQEAKQLIKEGSIAYQMLELYI
ncbi:MAG: NUDIX domain-containing protein [Candidatus Phytoplasma sp.]|nr:NUDIX domain-containing protein [Phytoplasma sp.]